MRNYNAIVREVDKRQAIKDILYKMDIAEAVYYGRAGMKPLNKWFTKQQYKIKRLRGIKIKTVWDRTNRKSRKI